MTLLEWAPLARSLRYRRPTIANRALIDFKTEEAWQARNEQKVKVRVRSRVFPFRVTECIVPLAQEGDAELLDLTGVPGQYRSNKTPKLTKQIRNQESRATTFATLARASKLREQKHILQPVIVAVQVAMLAVVAMLGWAYAQNQSLFGGGGPTF